MPYELFVGWRYLYARRRPRYLRLVLGIFVALAVLGVILFTLTPWGAPGAVLVIGGAMGAAFTAMLMLFSTFTAISMMGVALGVAILTWVLSVTSGFQEEFRRKVLGVNAHVLVLKYGTDFSEYRDVVRRCEHTRGVVAAGPFVFNEMMLARGQRLSGVLVKGVDPQRVGRVLDLPQHVKWPAGVQRGDLGALLSVPDPKHPGLAGAPPGVIIGRELAHKLNAHVGDPVRLISPLSGADGSSWTPTGELPRSRDFRVSAIFYSGFDEYDRRLVYVNLRAAQGFFDRGDVVTGVEMKLADVFGARALARKLASQLGSAYRTVDWSELNQNLFTALRIQKLFLEIVIGFIVVVAAFNMLAALAVLVIRKRREIAILKSLGTTSGGVACVFQSAGLLVWLVGTSLGLLFGYLGCVLLGRYGFPLDPKIYLLSRLPVRVRPIEMVLTAGFALVVCFLATLYPSIRAARLDPVKGLRV